MTDIERKDLSDESRQRLAGANAYYAGGLGVATYDLLAAEGSAALDGDVAFYLECATQYGEPVLELATGTGRVLWPLAEAGHQVTGIDLSFAMLESAQKKGNARPQQVRDRARLVQMDMTKLDLCQRFALALIPARSFNLLIEPADQRRCLETIRAHLVGGGHLVIDLFDPRLDLCIPTNAVQPDVRERLDPSTGRTIRRRVLSKHCDAVRQVIEERLRFEIADATGKVVESAETIRPIRWVLRQEMRYLFELCGFDVVEEFSDFTRASPAYGKEQIWIARRV